MPHTQALAWAAILRCRRRVLSSVMQISERVCLQGDAEHGHETWKSFEQLHMREVVQNIRPFLIMWSIHQLALACLAYQMESVEQAFVSGLSVVLTVTSLLITGLLQKWIRSAEENSPTEYRLMVILQCMIITTGFLYMLLNCMSSDGIVAHRGFCMKYVFLVMSMGYLLHLPMHIHIAVVSMQAILVWMFFHWVMDFITPVVVSLGFSIPLIEVVCFYYSRKMRWHVFRLMGQEKKSRLLSDALQETLRGVLNVTFDASCECDQNGFILCSSPHLQQLLVGGSLMQFSANAMETHRIKIFLSQICAQTEVVGSADRRMAVLETVLKCCGLGWDREDEEVKVKLCCVPLPADCTAHDAVPDGNCQRLFVGLQRLQVSDVVGPPYSSDLHKFRALEGTSGSSDPGDTRKDSGKLRSCSFPTSGSSDPGDRRKDSSGEAERSSHEHGDGNSPSLGNKRICKVESVPIASASDTVSFLPLSSPQVRNVFPIFQNLGPGEELHGSIDTRSDASGSVSGSLALSCTTYGGTQRSLPQRSSYTTCGTQTNTLPRQSISACTQTEQQAEKVVSRNDPQFGYPPRPPKKPKTSQRRSEHKSAHKGKPFLCNLPGTPANTVEFFVIETMCKINPCGGANSCCFWHASLSSMAFVTQQMLSRVCSRTAKPNKAWQCQSCYALHAEHSDDEEEDEPAECDACGDKRGKHCDLGVAGGSTAPCSSGASSLADMSASASDSQTDL